MMPERQQARRSASLNSVGIQREFSGNSANEFSEFAELAESGRPTKSNQPSYKKGKAAS